MRDIASLEYGSHLTGRKMLGSDAEEDVYGTSGDMPWISLQEGDAETFQTKNVSLRIVVILTCSLSVIGSLLIIFSYACFRHLRSKPREILMHISLMDLGVSLANLIGAAVYFDHYFHAPAAGISNSSLVPAGSLTPAKPVHYELGPVSETETPTARPAIEGLCKAQAFFAGYFTLGSIFWTIFLSMYIYLFLLYFRTKPKLPYYALCTSYFASYGVPLLVSTWLVLTGHLGYGPYNSSGWCTLIIQDPSTGKQNLYVAVFGNDLWIYMATVLILILYLASRNYIHKNMDPASRQQCRSLVYKFLFIPVVFVLLRLWTSILIILYTYIGLQESQVPHWINEILIYLSGIGDSGQGLANAILFILFSRKVRSSFWRCLHCRRQEVYIPDPAAPGEFVKRQNIASLNKSDDTAHLLCRSLEDNSLLIENAKYGIAGDTSTDPRIV